MSAVHPLFDLAAVTTSPFPTDRFTVADTSQNTGRRVNLPLPDLITHPSDYQDTQVLNTLDGFNLQPRLSIPFDGPIDVNSVNSQTVFLVSLGDTLNPHDHGRQVVGINQIFAAYEHHNPRHEVPMVFCLDCCRAGCCCNVWDTDDDGRPVCRKPPRSEQPFEHR